jgi:threonine/homoserine/homoserine lactone efflux protein
VGFAACRGCVGHSRQRLPGGIGVVSDSAWAIAAGTARSWLARSRGRLEAIAGAGGLVLIGLGVRLAVTGRRD